MISFCEATSNASLLSKKSEIGRLANTRNKCLCDLNKILKQDPFNTPTCINVSTNTNKLRDELKLIANPISSVYSRELSDMQTSLASDEATTKLASADAIEGIKLDVSSLETDIEQKCSLVRNANISIKTQRKVLSKLRTKLGLIMLKRKSDLEGLHNSHNREVERSNARKSAKLRESASYMKALRLYRDSMCILKETKEQALQAHRSRISSKRTSHAQLVAKVQKARDDYNSMKSAHDSNLADLENSLQNQQGGAKDVFDDIMTLEVAKDQHGDYLLGETSSLFSDPATWMTLPNECETTALLGDREPEDTAMVLRALTPEELADTSAPMPLPPQPQPEQTQENVEENNVDDPPPAISTSKRSARGKKRKRSNKAAA